MSGCEEPGTKRAYSRREPVPLASLPSDVWQVEHVAGALGVSESWVYKRVAAQEMPFTKRGGILRFDPAQVMAWAKGKEPTPATVVPLRGREK